MKKLLAIVVLGLLWCNVGFAEIVNKSMQELLNDNFKITAEEFASQGNYALKIFTLKKGKIVIICSLKLRLTSGVSPISRCISP